jgi:hypothetical protein
MPQPIKVTSIQMIFRGETAVDIYDGKDYRLYAGINGNPDNTFTTILDITNNVATSPIHPIITEQYYDTFVLVIHSIQNAEFFILHDMNFTGDLSSPTDLSVNNSAKINGTLILDDDIQIKTGREFTIKRLNDPIVTIDTFGKSTFKENITCNRNIKAHGMFYVGYGMYSLLQTIVVGDSITNIDISTGNSVGSKVILANTLREGKTFAVRTTGVLRTNTKQNLLIEVKMGTTLLSSGTIRIADLNNQYRFCEIELDICCRNITNNQASLISNGQLIYVYKDDTNIKDTYEGAGLLSGLASTGGDPGVLIDNTIDNDIQIFARWDTLNTANDFQIHTFTINSSS